MTCSRPRCGRRRRGCAAITAPVAADRVRGHRAAGPGPGVVLADPGRDDRHRARVPCRAARAGRGWRTSAPSWPPGCGWQASPGWASGQRLVAFRTAAARRPARGRPAAGTSPDAEIHWPSIAGSPYAGQVWAVEVELTPKPLPAPPGSWPGCSTSHAVRAGDLPDRPGCPARRDPGRGRRSRPASSPGRGPGPACRPRSSRSRRDDRLVLAAADRVPVAAPQGGQGRRVAAAVRGR